MKTVERRQAEGYNVEQIIQLRRPAFQGEATRSVAKRIPPAGLILLAWIAGIVLPWSALFWLAAFLGGLAA